MSAIDIPSTNLKELRASRFAIHTTRTVAHFRAEMSDFFHPVAGYTPNTKCVRCLKPHSVWYVIHALVRPYVHGRGGIVQKAHFHRWY